MASVWTGLSQDGDAFQLPASKKTEFTELANALNSDLIVEEIPTRVTAIVVMVSYFKCIYLIRKL